MPITPTINLTAASCPPVPVPSLFAASAWTIAGATNAPHGTAPVAEGVASGATFWTGNTRRDAARLDKLARYGGGAYAVGSGLSLSAGTGLLCSVAPGDAIIDGALEIVNPTTVPVPDNSSRVWIWLLRSGILYATTSTTLPTQPAALLGNVTTSGGVLTAIDSSGILTLRGGHAFRQTADTGAPTDTPDATAGFYAITGGGAYLWDGASYLPTAGTTGTPGANGTVLRFGSGAPAGTLGRDGDSYADTASANLDLYLKTGGAYSIIGEMRGAAGTSGTTTLAADTDVLLTSPADGQLLTYSATDGKWENKPPAALAALSNSVPAAETTGAAGSPGTSTASSRSDHVHAMPSAFPAAAHAASHAAAGTDAVSPSSIGALAASSNLSDLASAATARANLGLGTAALVNVPATGNATASQAVLGNDSRLTAIFTPAAPTAVGIFQTEQIALATNLLIFSAAYSAIPGASQGGVYEFQVSTDGTSNSGSAWGSSTYQSGGEFLYALASGSVAVRVCLHGQNGGAATAWTYSSVFAYIAPTQICIRRCLREFSYAGTTAGLDPLAVTLPAGPGNASVSWILKKATLFCSSASGSCGFNAKVSGSNLLTSDLAVSGSSFASTTGVVGTSFGSTSIINCHLSGTDTNSYTFALEFESSVAI